MKNRTLASTLLSALSITALAGTLFFNSVKANPIILEPRIVFEPPIEGKYFNSTTIPIQFQVYSGIQYFQPSYFNDTLLSVRCWIDGLLEEHVTGDDLLNPFSIILTDLSDREHTLEIFATTKTSKTYDGLSGSSGKIYFTVDTVTPRVQFVPSQQRTFDGFSSASFDFAAIELGGAVFQVGYSLDGKQMVTATDNLNSTILREVHNYQQISYQLTLGDLSDGVHSLIVFAEDLAGNVGESEVFQFIVGQEAQLELEQSVTKQHFSTMLTVASIFLMVAISLGAFAYFKKNKRRKQR